MPTKRTPSKGAQPFQREGPLILAFGAHPDDIEFGCGGVIARETQAGHAVHCVVCSRGEAGTNGTPEQRTREAEVAAKLLGASVEFTDLGGDAHMEHRVEHTVKLAAIIRRTRPRLVLAPTVMENQHPDHVVVGRMVRDAARLARYGGLAELKSRPRHLIEQLWFYAVSFDAEPNDRSAVLMDVSAPKVVAAWTAAMRAHASQAQTRSYLEQQLLRAQFHGGRCGVSHALPLFPNDAVVCESLATFGRAARQF